MRRPLPPTMLTKGARVTRDGQLATVIKGFLACTTRPDRYLVEIDGKDGSDAFDVWDARDCRRVP